MIECKDLAGKVVRSLTLFEEGSYGPEVSIDFDDGSNFNACLGVKMPLEAKWTRIRAPSREKGSSLSTAALRSAPPPQRTSAGLFEIVTNLRIPQKML
jgi:hypothetical protein